MQLAPLLEIAAAFADLTPQQRAAVRDLTDFDPDDLDAAEHAAILHDAGTLAAEDAEPVVTFLTYVVRLAQASDDDSLGDEATELAWQTGVVCLDIAPDAGFDLTG